MEIPSTPLPDGTEPASGPVDLSRRMVAPEQLRWTCDPAEFPFATTEEVPPLDGTVGQPRALSALSFGLATEAPGFNLFIAGQPGTGRRTTAALYLRDLAAKHRVPDDWCYVFNFKEPTQPTAIRLPPGRAIAFQEDMRQLLSAVRRDLRRVFESREYRQAQEEAHKAVTEARDRLLHDLSERAEKEGLGLTITPTGPAVIPLVNRRPMTPEELERLPEGRRTDLVAQSEQITQAFVDIWEQIRQLEKEAHERLTELHRQVARSTIAPLVSELGGRYGDQPLVVDYLNQVQEDLVAHDEELWRQKDGASESDQQELLPQVIRQMRGESEETVFARYRVNVLVNNQELKGAPVVFESNPTYYNLLGRVEYRGQLGAMVTDFGMIKPGALHRANGGYLVLNALDVLINPFAWSTLKRALQTGELRVENMGEQYMAFPAATLRPQPIPLDVKVVLIGVPLLYYLLYFQDEDFPKLFRVRADFDSELKSNAEQLANYAAFVSSQVRQLNLKHFDRGAVAKIAEYGARLTEHQGRLSARFKDVGDVVVEASQVARKSGSPLVMADHVSEAIDAKTFRSNLIEEKLSDLVEEGTLLIDTAGSRVGQVNGLSILDVGDYSFGRPVRITAQTALGGEGVMNLERETKLSGRIHNKGFLILTSFFMARYAQDKPLALAARITFEQTYDEIEGDSASCAELCGLLSALGGLPLRQDIAITGSVNQLGEVQPVGGVTRKIEGFFETCKLKGLTGEQGVIIPARNVNHLMLSEEIVASARDGRFHVWAVDTVDQAIEILTGVPAGQQQPDGNWPEGTVNGRVDRHLREYAECLKAYNRPVERGELRERTPAEVGPRTPRIKRKRPIHTTD